MLDLILMSHDAGQADSIPDPRRLGYNIVLLSFAFFMFLAVILYHLWKRVIEMPLRKRILPRFGRESIAETVKTATVEAVTIKQVDDAPMTNPSQTIVSLPPMKSDKVIRCRRETLLIDDSYIDYAVMQHAQLH